MVEKLTDQFSGVGEELMSGMQACNTTTETFFSEEVLKSLATHYRIQLKSEEPGGGKGFTRRSMKKETDSHCGPNA